MELASIPRRCFDLRRRQVQRTALATRTSMAATPSAINITTSFRYTVAASSPVTAEPAELPVEGFAFCTIFFPAGCPWA